MAIISLEEKTVMVEDTEKSIEIQNAIDNNEAGFKEISAAVETQQIKEAVRKWF